MKKSVILATLVAAATFHLTPSEAAAQRGPSVAIIDLGYIFKNHARFKALNEDMRRDVEAAEAELKIGKEALRKLSERLEDFRRGTPEFKSLEEELAKRQADLSLQVNIQKKGFMEQEAKNYYTVYRDIMDRVKYYSDNNGIDLVLRFNGDPIDDQDPQEVLKELNKSVLYYNRAIDITPMILDLVNADGERRAPPPAAATKPRAGVPRQ